ncbi:hypothetical protein LTS09_017689 [Friedmanniomyces endolithicus]|nr:hypothetical protein LTS09_017689 [Friedmanniomyces endolithicus]
MTASDVQIYTDIDNTWAGQFDEHVRVGWGYSLSNDSTSAFTLTPGGTATYSEYNNTAQWGTSVYCARPNNSTLTATVGGRDAVRAQFAANGSVSGPWKWQCPGATAYAQDLGKVSKAGKNVTFAIGYWRQSAVNYLGNTRTAYFTATCSDPICGCVHVLNDFEATDAEARKLDAAIASKAAKVAGAKYSDIVTLSLRQAFGAMDITISEGKLDTGDPLAFVKEISSDGNVNTIDVIYPIAPMLYVLAPGYLRLLLESIMRYLSSGAWPHNYAVHDLGAAYPNATGHKNGRAEKMPVEECGSLLTLFYMYQLATGDKIWAAQYHNLLQTYADYLVSNGLFPTKQLSSDDGLGNISNQTSLAIKAAIGLNAYGVMIGQRNYSDIGNATYAMQSSYYPTVRMPRGIPLDSLVGLGKTDWMMFAAATAVAPGVGNVGVRDMLIDDVHAFMANGINAVPFSDKFHLRDSGTIVKGAWSQYKARLVVGGHSAIMALDGPSLFGNVDGGDGARTPTMVAVDLLPGIDISITVAGQALTEHEDHDEEQQDRTAIRYIEAVSGQIFEVRIAAQKGFRSGGDVLSFQVHVDGSKVVDEPLLRNSDCISGDHVIASAGSQSSASVRRYRFAALGIASEGPKAAHETSQLKNLGSIVVTIHQMHMTGAGKAKRSSKDLSTHGVVSEKALKGQALSHSIDFTAPAASGTVHFFKVKRVQGLPNPYATVIFRYRSIEALKSMLIIPRTPTPPPLQEREYDSIDRQDVLELQRQLKAMKEKHKLRNVKVKRERTDDNPRRRKVARSSRHSTQLELDEEGGVRESATPTLAEREIIELD